MHKNDAPFVAEVFIEVEIGVILCFPVEVWELMYVGNMYAYVVLYDVYQCVSMHRFG